jgi:hypothetical protein
MSCCINTVISDFKKQSSSSEGGSSRTGQETVCSSFLHQSIHTTTNYLTGFYSVLTLTGFEHIRSFSESIHLKLMIF